MALTAETRYQLASSDLDLAKVPRFNRYDWLVLAVIVILTFLYLLPLRTFVQFNADEGILLLGADRILHGQLPYRDFFTFYTPGSFYLDALMLKLSAGSISSARDLVLFFLCSFTALTYWFVRQMHDRITASFAAVLIAFGYMPFRLMIRHNWDSTFFALLCVGAMFLLLRSPQNRWALAGGLAASATFLTEQSKGGGLLLGIALATAVLLVPFRHRLRLNKTHGVWFCAGFAVPIVLVAGYFAYHNALGVMLQSWVWPLQHYSLANHVPYGWNQDSFLSLQGSASDGLAVRAFILLFTLPLVLIPLFPVLVLATTAHKTFLLTAKRSSESRDLYVLGGCIFAGVLLSTVATRRSDVTHLIYIAPLFVYLIPGVLDRDVPAFSLRRTRPILASLLVLSFAGFGMATSLKARQGSVTLATRRGVVRTDIQDEAVPYIQRNLPAGAPLYVHPYQPLYVFLTATRNPIRYDFLQAGMNTKEQFQEAAEELARKKPPVVLLDPAFASDMIPETWPSTPAEALAYDPVEQYILRAYRNCKVLNAGDQHIWHFYYMVRKDLPCPPDR